MWMAVKRGAYRALRSGYCRRRRREGYVDDIRCNGNRYESINPRLCFDAASDRSYASLNSRCA